MTKRTNNLAARRPRRRGGFTLVELLAVVLIIMILTGMLYPTIANVRTVAMGNMTRSLLATLEGAIRDYYSQVEDPATGKNVYPPAVDTLVQALTGREAVGVDGKDGFGWRMKYPPGTFRGRVYGPFGGTDQLKYVSVSSKFYFVDAFDQTILYYPFKDGKYTKTLATDGGPADVDAYAKGPNGYLRKDFILVSKGPDEKWEAPYVGGAPTKSDDITNLE